MAEVLKKCSLCGGEKPTTEFYTKGKRHNSLEKRYHSRCKSCDLELIKQKAAKKKRAAVKVKVPRGKLLTNLEVIPLNAVGLPTEPLELWVQFLEGV